MPFEIIRNDITKVNVDVIVNAANTNLRIGGGVCGAIFHAAGSEKLKKACDEIGYCPVGKAVITDGFNLPAKYIIHTPGPIWEDGTGGEATLLEGSYKNALELAIKHQCSSIAFPLISTGIYGYPKKEALQIAISTISDFLLNNDMFVYLVVFDKQAFGLSEKLHDSIKEYIDEHYVEEVEETYHRRIEESFDVESEDVYLSESIIDLVNDLEESFSERLVRFIDEKGISDVAAYKKANVDRKLYSKIRNQAGYTPKKKTVIAFAIALNLDVEQTNELLSTAGYTLSRSNKFDVIIAYFIKEGTYNIHEINEVLFSFDQPLLGV